LPCWLGFLAALLVSFPAFGQFSAFFAGAALLAVIGLLDDLGEVSATSKMLVQVLAAVFMTSWGGNYLVTLGDLFDAGPVLLRDWAIPVTVFATIAIINSVNMFDGLDGLAGSLVFVILVFFAGFAWTVGDVNARRSSRCWPVRWAASCFSTCRGGCAAGTAPSWVTAAAWCWGSRWHGSRCR
jgi:UDP-GlcNAc:undecaprenyl-phosphate/decaprenyl-phosphate GlcNAc-1-phosphate transferase